MLLKKRTSASNEKTRTRDSTRYRGKKKKKEHKCFSEGGEEGEQKE